MNTSDHNSLFIIVLALGANIERLTDTNAQIFHYVPHVCVTDFVLAPLTRRLHGPSLNYLALVRPRAPSVLIASLLMPKELSRVSPLNLAKKGASSC